MYKPLTCTELLCVFDSKSVTFGQFLAEVFSFSSLLGSGISTPDKNTEITRPLFSPRSRFIKFSNSPERSSICESSS